MFRAAPSLWGDPHAFQSTPAERKLSMLKWHLNMASLKTLKVAETINFNFCFISKSKLELTGTFFFFFSLGWSGKPVQPGHQSNCSPCVRAVALLFFPLCQESAITCVTGEPLKFSGCSSGGHWDVLQKVPVTFVILKIEAG